MLIELQEVSKQPAKSSEETCLIVQGLTLIEGIKCLPFRGSLKIPAQGLIQEVSHTIYWRRNEISGVTRNIFNFFHLCVFVHVYTLTEACNPPGAGVIGSCQAPDPLWEQFHLLNGWAISSVTRVTRNILICPRCPGIFWECRLHESMNGCDIRWWWFRAEDHTLGKNCIPRVSTLSWS